MRIELRRQAAQTAEQPVRQGIPEHGRVPAHYAVKVKLLEVIGKAGFGEVLPAERELADRFGVSRLTLRQAVTQLMLDGRLRRRQGSGTYVTAPKLVQPLALESYTEGLRCIGVEPGRTLITFEQCPAIGELAAELGIAGGDEVIHIERVLLADGERAGLESTYLPAARVPGLSGVFDPAQSLYACLRERFGVVFARATERVETVLATPREALLLGTNPSMPMLLLHRSSWDADGRPIERVRSLFRGDRFSFLARLTAEQ